MDSHLETSNMFTNVQINLMPRRKIVHTLLKYKGYLQTVGLICNEDERALLSECFVRSGVTRNTRAGHMSETFYGEAHDGEYPLQRYVRTINLEQ